MEIAKKHGLIYVITQQVMSLWANSKENEFSEAGRVYQDSQDLPLFIEGMLIFALQFKTICN